MSRLLPVTVAMRTLRRQPLPPRCRITDDQAVEWLRRCTGQDFDLDAVAWSARLWVNRWAYYRVPATAGLTGHAEFQVPRRSGGAGERYHVIQRLTVRPCPARLG